MIWRVRDKDKELGENSFNISFNNNNNNNNNSNNSLLDREFLDRALRVDLEVIFHWYFSLSKELSLSHRFLNSHIFAIWWCKPFIFQT